MTGFLAVMLLIAFLGIMAGGCSLLAPDPVVPTGTKTTQRDILDESGAVVQRETVTQTDTVPDAVSPEVSAMTITCLEYFDNREKVPDAAYNKMNSADIKDVLIFRDFRLGLERAHGINPVDVCSSPANFYDYAMAHDRALFEATTRIVGSITAVIPGISHDAALAIAFSKAIDAAGDKVAGDKVGGDQLKAGRDQSLNGYTKQTDERNVDYRPVHIGDAQSNQPLQQGVPEQDSAAEEAVSTEGGSE